jgi:hypothetical protein
MHLDPKTQNVLSMPEKDSIPPKSRASRMSLSTALQYRSRGSKEWREGTLVNISATGVLFRADSAIKLGTRIEMQFSLPMQPERLSSSCVISCHGAIVRVAELGLLGAKISASRLLRR